LVLGLSKSSFTTVSNTRCALSSFSSPLPLLLTCELTNPSPLTCSRIPPLYSALSLPPPTTLPLSAVFTPESRARGSRIRARSVLLFFLLPHLPLIFSIAQLWGVKNIFKFSENVSLTEMAIKRADLAELEYALKNTTLSAYDTESGKFEDMPEEDYEEVVAEVTGFSKKAAADQGAPFLSLLLSSTRSSLISRYRPHSRATPRSAAAAGAASCHQSHSRRRCSVRLFLSLLFLQYSLTSI
jgi:hypothetical protein